MVDEFPICRCGVVEEVLRRRKVIALDNPMRRHVLPTAALEACKLCFGGAVVVVACPEADRAAWENCLEAQSPHWVVSGASEMQARILGADVVVADRLDPQWAHVALQSFERAHFFFATVEAHRLDLVARSLNALGANLAPMAFASAHLPSDEGALRRRASLLRDAAAEHALLLQNNQARGAVGSEEATLVVAARGVVECATDLAVASAQDGKAVVVLVPTAITLRRVANNVRAAGYSVALVDTRGDFAEGRAAVFVSCSACASTVLATQQNAARLLLVKPTRTQLALLESAAQPMQVARLFSDRREAESVALAAGASFYFTAESHLARVESAFAWSDFPSATVLTSLRTLAAAELGEAERALALNEYFRDLAGIDWKLQAPWVEFGFDGACWARTDNAAVSGIEALSPEGAVIFEGQGRRVMIPAEVAAGRRVLLRARYAYGEHGPTHELQPSLLCAVAVPRFRAAPAARKKARRSDDSEDDVRVDRYESNPEEYFNRAGRSFDDEPPLLAVKDVQCKPRCLPRVVCEFRVDDQRTALSTHTAMELIVNPKYRQTIALAIEPFRHMWA